MELLLLVLAIFATKSFAMDNLRVAFEWKELDFAYPTEEERSEALKIGEFIPKNNLPLGLEVYNDRLFITVPRWKPGVPASLNYINLSDPKDSPKLHPYPNLQAHSMRFNSTPEIVSPFRIRADQCGRLWVIDTGLDDITGAFKSLRPPRLLIYDLDNDALIRSYEIPQEQIKDDSFFANVAVEDHDCQNSFAYLADLGKPAIVVYSWKKDNSWRVTHNYFNIDPLAGEFNVSGIPFNWTDGVFGLALSAPDEEGFSTLYFHPLTSFLEFSVNTRVLRNETWAKTGYHDFKILGSRGPRGQSTASFLDQKSNVLFYGLVNLNAVACWRTTNPNYTMESQGRILMNNVTMVFPNDLKVDANSNLWVLSDRLPVFMYSELDRNDVNYRILTAAVSDAIRGTACDSKLVLNPKMVDKIKPIVNLDNKLNKNPKSSSANFAGSSLTVAVYVLVAIFYNYYF